MNPQEPTAADSHLVSWVQLILLEGCELWGAIPQCWACHPGVVEELGILAALYRETEKPSEWLTFFDALERSVRRIAAQYPTAKCLASREHQTPRRWCRDPDRRAAAG